MTILEMVFPQSLKGSPSAERRFLKRLHALLGDSIKPIVVTDAGFRTPWFPEVAKLGWHYVGRLRCRARIQLDGGDWFDNRRLFPQATRGARRYAATRIVVGNPWQVDLVLYKSPHKVEFDSIVTARAAAS